MSVLRECAGGGGGISSVVTSGCITGSGTADNPVILQLAPAGGLTCGVNGLYVSATGIGGGCTIAFSYEGVEQTGTPTEPIDPSSLASIQVEVKDNVINFWGNPSGTWILDKTFTGGESYFTGETDNGNSGASKTIDFTTKANQKLTLTADCTLTFTPPSSARSVLMRFVQDGTGGWEPTFPGSVLGSVTVASGAAAQTVVNLYYDGTNYHV